LAGPLGGKPLKRLIITHHHSDHIGLAGWLAQETGAAIWTSRTAWLTANLLRHEVDELPPPEQIAYWKAAGMSPEMLAQKSGQRPYNSCDYVHALPRSYHRLHAGMRLTVGGRHWRIISGGGHAPEQLIFIEEGGDLVIGGDQLLPAISPNIGVWASEPAADPLREWFESLDEIAPLARESQLVLPGHKLPFTGLPLRIGQLRQNQIGALKRLKAHLSTPQKAVDCFMPMFKREITGSAWGLALAETLAHLNYLEAEGEITRRRDEQGADLWQLNPK